MITPVFRGKFASGKFQLEQGERERLEQWCRGQKNGSAVLRIARNRERSMPYHRYFFGVIVKMCAEHFQTPHLGMYILLMQQFRPLTTESGELSFQGISKMNTAEMIALGQEICEHMLNTYGLRIPEPNEIELQEVHELQSRYA